MIRMHKLAQLLQTDPRDALGHDYNVVGLLVHQGKMLSMINWRTTLTPLSTDEVS